MAVGRLRAMQVRSRRRPPRLTRAIERAQALVAVLLVGALAWPAVDSAATGARAAPAPRVASRPHIVWRPIPFGHRRKRETAAYARRHYGIHTWRLRNPHVIVEHYTGGNSFGSARATFASDSPALRHRPGACAAV